MKLDLVKEKIREAGFKYVKVEIEGTYDLDEASWLGDGDPYESAKRVFMERLPNDARDALHYLKFYADGVEATLTIPVNEIDHIPTYIRVFKRMGQGLDFNDDDCGLHITLLVDGTYPGRRRLSKVKIENLHHAINTHFLPALVLLGSRGDGWTRNSYAREPQSCDHNKYSALYTGGKRFLEFRVFDPVFHQPNRVFTYLSTIARLMAYYSRKRLPDADPIEMDEFSEGRIRGAFEGWSKQDMAAAVAVFLPERKRTLKRLVQLPIAAFEKEITRVRV